MVIEYGSDDGKISRKTAGCAATRGRFEPGTAMGRTAARSDAALVQGGRAGQQRAPKRVEPRNRPFVPLRDGRSFDFLLEFLTSHGGRYDGRKTMDKIVALSKGRGFVFAVPEIYDGWPTPWDYGPVGVELKNNVKKAWWRKFVQESPQRRVGLDAAILMNPQAWVASGHVGGFAGPADGLPGNARPASRADKLIEDHPRFESAAEQVVSWDVKQMEAFIASEHIPCPECGKHDFTPIRQFNLMFKTFQGVTGSSRSQIYLRPETAQGIFVNYKNVTCARPAGKSPSASARSASRSETRSRRQLRSARASSSRWNSSSSANPATTSSGSYTGRTSCFDWLLSLGMRRGKPAHARPYARGTLALLQRHYRHRVPVPFGAGAANSGGIADRTDFDLKQHAATRARTTTTSTLSQRRNYIAYCVEPSLGGRPRDARFFMRRLRRRDARGRGDRRRAPLPPRARAL